MPAENRLPHLVEESVAGRRPFLWLNEGWCSVDSQSRRTQRVSLRSVHDAEHRLKRFAPLLATLFPELRGSGGIIESPLCPANRLQSMMTGASSRKGRWFIKADHQLPVAGSIKARGGIYELLLHAERVALRRGLTAFREDTRLLASAQATELFAQHRVLVGSTGNLGLSVGVMAAALGFHAIVHMSSDAKAWKKAHLRARGADVIEHDGDFGAAVAAGRKMAQVDPSAYFVDDEDSQSLFLGYSVATLRLKQQLLEQGVTVDREHPLFVYLPCGVGGAPGGITFGLRELFGDAVHCFLAQPLASPCVLIRLAALDDKPISVRAVGLDGRTEADGLAVGMASEFAACVMKPLVSGAFTVLDDDLFENLFLLEQAEGMRVEPSAAAGFRGPLWLLESDAGDQYLRRRGLLARIERATHVLWTTGGAFVPDEEFGRFRQRGYSIHTASSLTRRIGRAAVRATPYVDEL